MASVAPVSPQISYIFAHLSMLASAPVAGASRSVLPVPVSAKSDANVTRRVVAKRAPALITFSMGLASLFPSHPKVVLLFVGASVVMTIGSYFVVLPREDEKLHPAVAVFLRTLPDTLTALGGTLCALGVAHAFPGQAALIPLFTFIALTTLPMLSIIGSRTSVIIYGSALLALVPFAVLASMA